MNELYIIQSKGDTPRTYLHQIGSTGDPEFTLNVRQAMRYVNRAEPELFLDKKSLAKSYEVVTAPPKL